jgi:PIN domain
VAKNIKMPEMDALLFVDTSILLDFYRIQKSDISMKYLEQLEACKERLIVGAQIEMEYKKNRQKVIVDSLKQFSTPDWKNLSTPTIVAGLQASKMIEKKREEITIQHKTVNEKIQKILTNPSQNDPVFQSLQRLFKSDSPYNLNRDSKKRFTIRRLARKRFCLGYPPRKSNDTSIGDAVNWEWIVQCAIDSGKDIVIVTRDADYGVTYKEKSYLNDWLKQEFQQRVSRRRKILLTHRLSDGLKIVHAAVTEEMEKAEQQLIEGQNILDASHQNSIGEFIE